MFNRIILSRKGFDSKAGGEYSPFDPQTGKYILLPIPDGEIGNYIGNGTLFEQIEIKQDYLPGIHSTNLGELINNLGYKQKTKDKIFEHYAHFDPWLGECPWIAEGSNHSIGAFGQVGSPQTQLKNQRVGKGDLFLFFSRFKPINRENAIVPDIIRDNIKEGLYFIYGWFKVNKVIERYNDIDDKDLLKRHPHATQAYFKEKNNNTIYIADELLFPNESIPGCGYFPKLSKDLLLTAIDQKSQKNWIPSRWELPVLLYNKCISVLTNRQCGDGSSSDSCIVNTQGQWQEAIFEGSEEFNQRLYKLILKSS
jgi:hypothetical protein